MPIVEMVITAQLVVLKVYHLRIYTNKMKTLHQFWIVEVSNLQVCNHQTKLSQTEKHLAKKEFICDEICCTFFLCCSLLDADMNATLTKVLMKACICPVLLGERFAVEHMMLLALLHCRVGIEVGQWKGCQYPFFVCRVLMASFFSILVLEQVLIFFKVWQRDLASFTVTAPTTVEERSVTVSSYFSLTSTTSK